LHDSAGGVGTSKGAVDLAGRMPETVLRGEVVLLDGRVAAFAFGGEIRPGIGCIFDTSWLASHGPRNRMVGSAGQNAAVHRVCDSQVLPPACIHNPRARY
jgi:hypothetical protein